MQYINYFKPICQSAKRHDTMKTSVAFIDNKSYLLIVKTFGREMYGFNHEFKPLILRSLGLKLTP